MGVHIAPTDLKLDRIPYNQELKADVSESSRKIVDTMHSYSVDRLEVDPSSKYLVKDQEEQLKTIQSKNAVLQEEEKVTFSEKIRRQRLLGFFNEVGAGFYNLPKIGPSILTLSYLPVIAYIGVHVAHDSKKAKEQYGTRASVGTFVVELLKHLTTSVFLPTTLVFTGARATEILMRRLENSKSLQKPLENANNMALFKKFAVYPNDRLDTFKTVLKDIAPKLGVSEQIIRTVEKDLPHKNQKAWLPVVQEILEKNKLRSSELIDITRKYDATNLKMPQGFVGAVTKPFEIISIPMEHLVEFIFNSLNKAVVKTKNEPWINAFKPIGENVTEALEKSIKASQKISSRRGLTSVAMTIGGISSLLSFYKYTDHFGEKLIEHIVVPIVGIFSPEVKKKHAEKA